MHIRRDALQQRALLLLLFFVLLAGGDDGMPDGRRGVEEAFSRSTVASSMRVTFSALVKSECSWRSWAAEYIPVELRALKVEFSLSNVLVREVGGAVWRVRSRWDRRRGWSSLRTWVSSSAISWASWVLSLCSATQSSNGSLSSCALRDCGGRPLRGRCVGRDCHGSYRFLRFILPRECDGFMIKRMNAGRKSAQSNGPSGSRIGEHCRIVHEAVLGFHPGAHGFRRHGRSREATTSPRPAQVGDAVPGGEQRRLAGARHM